MSEPKPEYTIESTGATITISTENTSRVVIGVNPPLIESAIRSSASALMQLHRMQEREIAIVDATDYEAFVSSCQKVARERGWA